MVVDPESRRGSSGSAWTGQAFGLALTADFEMPGLSSRAPAGRSCDLLLLSDDALIPGAWTEASERIFEWKDTDGESASVVDMRADGCARVWGRDRGEFFVSGDGSKVWCQPDPVEPWQWRRFLVGQVLPLAALLHGFEILHASAVALDESALVLAGPQGAGKSSVAAQLVLRGAAFLADDVVSVERQGDAVLAHPGTPVIGLRHEERVAWSARDLRRLGAPVAEREAEALVAVACAAKEPAQLSAVYLLDRWSTTDGIAFQSVPDPRYLLATTFNSVLQTRERLVRMLDVYSALSRVARVFRVGAPASATAGDVADAVRDHLRAQAGKGLTTT